MVERLDSGPAWVTGIRNSEPFAGLIPRAERVARPGYRLSVPGRGGFSAWGTRELVAAWWGRKGYLSFS